MTGANFKTLHEFLEEEYDNANDFLDEIAEQQKMNGEFPKASMKEYLELTTIEEKESKDYTAAEVLLEVKSDYMKIVKDIQELKSEQPAVTVNVLEDIEAEFVKKITGINQTLK